MDNLISFRSRCSEEYHATKHASDATLLTDHVACYVVLHGTQLNFNRRLEEVNLMVHLTSINHEMSKLSVSKHVNDVGRFYREKEGKRSGECGPGT